jgi:hypothetical protein
MSSSIKHIVEPTLGWMFIVVLLVALCTALLAWTRPTMEANGPDRTEVERAR